MSTTKWITIITELCRVIGGTWLLICVASISWEFPVVKGFGYLHLSIGKVISTGVWKACIRLGPEGVHLVFVQDTAQELFARFCIVSSGLSADCRITGPHTLQYSIRTCIIIQFTTRFNEFSCTATKTLSSSPAKTSSFFSVPPPSFALPPTDLLPLLFS